MLVCITDRWDLSQSCVQVFGARIGCA